MKHRIFLVSTLGLFVALFASTNSRAQSVADDFWIYDFSVGSGNYTVKKNDDRPYSNFNFVSGPSYGNAFWYATGTMGYNAGSTSQVYLDTASYKSCEGNPLKCTNTATVLILVIGNGENNLDYGAACPISKGRPVNVGNGNMWLRQSDYNLPGLGEPIRIERFYNSRLQQASLFGLGWTTDYDESLTIYEDRLVRLNMPDARGVYFARANTSDPFRTVSPDARAGLVKNVDDTYTLTFEDGRVHKFNASGRLEWQQDRNGNQTTLSYNGNGHLVSVTDAVGRVVTLTPNSNGTIAQVSDSIGVIADYEYFAGTTHLKTVTYPDGSKYKFEYNTTAVAGKVYLATVKDALDNVLETHQYDSQGRATTSEVDGGVEKYTINYTNSQLSTVTDALGRVSKYSYKHQYGRKTLTSVEGVCGCGSGGSEITAYEYDWVPRITKETDALGRITRYTYDLDGNLLLRDDPVGDQKWTYDSAGRVLTYKDRSDSAIPDPVTTDNTTSLSTPFSYAGNLTTGGPTNYTSYISNDVNDPRSVTYYNVNGILSFEMYYIWHSSVGDSGFQIEKSADNTNWSALTTSVYSNTNIGGGWTRKRIRNLTVPGATYIRITYLNNNATYPWSLGIDRVDLTTPSTVYTVANTYDANGNLLTTTDALGNTTTLAYTPLGQLSTITDANSNATSLTYDTYGRLIQVTDANSKNTTYGYDARARVTSRTNALSETTNFEYDLNNRLKKVTHPDTNYREFTYDLAGRRTVVKDERGNTTNYGYDDAYRLTSVTDPLNHATSMGYDIMSNLTSRTDALGNTTNYDYDDFNRLKKLIHPPATTGAIRLEESLTYDKVGNIKTRIDTAGRTTSYDYDTLNRPLKITDPLLKLTQFEYNLRSQMTKVKDALSQEYIFTYDALGRELTQTRAGSTRSFQYDAVGNRTQRTDYLGRVTNYQYDALNRLTNINYVSSSAETVTLGYDDISRLTSAVNGAGTVSFTYDNRNRVKTTTDVFGHVIEYSYDANGNRTELKLDSNVHTTYAYNTANLLTTLSDDTSQNFTYAYDLANNLTSKTMPNGVSSTFDYDGISRLTRLKHQSGSSTLVDNNFTYNTANQISQIAQLAQARNFTYDNVNRLTSMTNGTSNESYTYDGVGNRTASHLSATYTYQPYNRMTATATASMSYNANGNLMQKTEGGNTRQYTWDYENRMTLVTDSAETVHYSYDALGRRVERYTDVSLDDTKYTYDDLDVVREDDLVLGVTKYQNGLDIDNKLSLKTGGVTKYFLQDHVGSTVALTDSTGGVAEQTSYDSFGKQTTSVSSRYQYTGREYDSFSGFYYYRARWYDAETGRFISEDPIGFSGKDINLYGYVHNSPLNRIDPFGLEDCPFLFQWYCDSKRASYEREYDQQLIKNTEKVIVNSNCLRKNSNFLFLEIYYLARHNYSISTTAYFSQGAEIYSTVGSPVPTKPNDLFDSTYDGMKGPLKNRLSNDRNENNSKIEDRFRSIIDANRRNPKGCGCRISE